MNKSLSKIVGFSVVFLCAGCSKPNFPASQELYDELKAIMCAEKNGVPRTIEYINRQRTLNDLILSKVAPNNTFSSVEVQVEHAKRFGETVKTDDCDRVKNVKINLGDVVTANTSEAVEKIKATSTFAKYQGTWILDEDETRQAIQRLDPEKQDAAKMLFMALVMANDKAGILIEGNRLQNGQDICYIETVSESDGSSLCLKKQDRSTQTTISINDKNGLVLTDPIIGVKLIHRRK